VSSCSKARKMRSCWSSGMPMPVSRTVKRRPTSPSPPPAPLPPLWGRGSWSGSPSPLCGRGGGLGRLRLERRDHLARGVGFVAELLPDVQVMTTAVLEIAVGHLDFPHADIRAAQRQLHELVGPAERIRLLRPPPLGHVAEHQDDARNGAAVVEDG